MRRSMYLVFAERSLVSCSLEVLEWFFGMHCDHFLQLPWLIVYNYSFIVYDKMIHAGWMNLPVSYYLMY